MKMTDQNKPDQMPLSGFGAHRNLSGVVFTVCQTGRKAAGQFFLPVTFACRVISLLALTVSVAKAGTFYKCTDAAGRILFTNNQPQGKSSCVVLSRQRDPVSASQGERSAGGRFAASPAPGDFPRVSGSEQRARDNDRRSILEAELAKEQQQLTEVRKLMTPTGSLPPVPRDAAALHERNIKALQKEIGNLR